MDEKTLQYMKERVTKGESILKARKSVEEFLQKVINKQDVYQIEFYVRSSSNYTIQNERLIRAIRSAAIEAAQAELKVLEQEFAEL